MATDNLISSTVSLLSTNWNNANTGSVTPALKDASDVKRIGGDSVLVHSIAGPVSDNASGAQTKKKVKTIVINCRSFKSHAQALLISEEVERIMNANQVDPFGDQVYDISDVDDVEDLSETTRGLFMFKVLVKFEQFNIAI